MNKAYLHGCVKIFVNVWIVYHRVLDVIHFLNSTKLINGWHVYKFNDMLEVIDKWIILHHNTKRLDKHIQYNMIYNFIKHFYWHREWEIWAPYQYPIRCLIARSHESPRRASEFKISDNFECPCIILFNRRGFGSFNLELEWRFDSSSHDNRQISRQSNYKQTSRL